MRGLQRVDGEGAQRSYKDATDVWLWFWQINDFPNETKSVWT